MKISRDMRQWRSLPAGLGIMFGTVDRYILLEVLKVFIAILGAFLLIALSMLFLRTLEEVSVGALGNELIMRFVGLRVVREISSLIPPIFFVAILIALGRMARDSELIALGACGLGPGRIYRSLLYLALPVALVTVWFSFVLRPMAVTELQKILHQRKNQAHQIKAVKQGRFYQQGKGLVTVYVGKIEDKQHLRNIFVHDRRGDRSRLVISHTGLRRVDAVSGDQFVTLVNGRYYDGIPGQPDYSIGAFERYNLRLDPVVLEHFRSGKRAGLRTAVLVGSDDLRDRAELLYRIGNPLAIFTLMLLTIPLVARSPRQRAEGRMLLAFLIYFGFFNLQRLAANWFETGATPSWLGSLWYQALMLVLVLAILAPESRWSRQWMRRLPRTDLGETLKNCRDASLRGPIRKPR